MNPDWRSSLFTIFVGNLSNRVSRGSLWEAFLSYGKVMDVFIHQTSRRSNKESTFAFVRYRKESEMIKAIEQGHGRKVDGWFIRVNKASYGWGDRRRYVQDRQKNLPTPGRAIKGPAAAFRDNRSYREVLTGDRAEVTSKACSPREKRNTADTSINTAPADQVNKPKKVDYDLDIPKAEMEWLNMSARGSFKDGFNYKSVAKKMKEAGFNCLISPLDNIAVLLTFQSIEEMLAMIKEDQLKPWFADIVPWR